VPRSPAVRGSPMTGLTGVLRLLDRRLGSRGWCGSIRFSPCCCFPTRSTSTERQSP
jgi:hypothetical protein